MSNTSIVSQSTSTHQPTKDLRTTSNNGINPLGIKPLGNLLLSTVPSSRSSGLGKLSVFSDEILLIVFSELNPRDLFRVQSVSKFFFGWCARLDCLWKPMFISDNAGRLSNWRSDWRKSYIYQFILRKDCASQGDHSLLPSDHVRANDVFSDVLFQPILCASHSVELLIKSHRFKSNIEKLSGTGYNQSLGLKPTIFTNLMESWQSYQSQNKNRPSWTLEVLSDRYPNVEFRAESSLTTLSDYKKYHDDCVRDESPVYLFDSQFVEKTSSHEFGMAEDFNVPDLFGQDLFSCLGNELRPDYRWLIIGPARSGSTWHKDPNGTSAWNAVITGRKLWICFPPHITPPGVYVSGDEAEVESPLSIAEWFINYYKEAKAIYGSHAKDPQTRGLMMEGICEAGEIFYVPFGWWHLVVNLKPSIAITQNFVSEIELTNVLHFMKYKSNQISGFDKLIENQNQTIFDLFLNKLIQSNQIDRSTLEINLKQIDSLENNKTLKEIYNVDNHDHISSNKRKTLDRLSVWEKIKKKAKKLQPDHQDTDEDSFKASQEGVLQSSSPSNPQKFVFAFEIP